MPLDTPTTRSKWREFALLFTCYALALAPPFLTEIWKNYSGVYYLYDSREKYILNTLLILLLISSALAWATQHTGKLKKTCFVLTMLSLSSLGTLALVHIALYDAPISVGAIDALLGTDLHEAVEYLSFHWTKAMLFSVSGYGILFLATLVWIRPRLSRDRPKASAHFVIWAALGGLILLAYQFPSIAAYHHPSFDQRPIWSRAAELNRQLPSLRILHDVGNWLAYRQWLEAAQQVRAGHDFGAVLGDASHPRTVVLVLGESLRRDHMSIYGYPRPTTPHLSARRKQILAFDSAISPSNQTVPSVTKILTPATIEEPDRFLTEPSILVAAKKAGYRTYWLSNQGRVGQFDSLISLIAHDAETSIFTNTEFYSTIYDEALLHPLEVALQDPYPHKFIVLHTLGSHQTYRNRYPSEKAFFQGADYASEVSDQEQATVLSEYDNSVRYTDEVLDGFIRMLEKQPDALLLYVSDHGERLYSKEVGDCGHGFPEPMKSEFNIPYFLWCKGSCPRLLKRIHAKNRSVAFNTENLFHTLANLLGLKMDSYRPELDILSPKYLPVWQPKIIDVNRGIHTYSSLPK